jgi:hypothetical protein
MIARPVKTTFKGGATLTSHQRFRRVMTGSLLVVASLCGYATWVSTMAGATSKPMTVPALQRAIKDGARLKSLPEDTTPSLASLSGADTEMTTTGPLTPQRCLDYNSDQSSVPICDLGDASSPRTMVLLGDSQARMWAQAFNLVAAKERERLIILDKDGCPPWLATFLTAGLSPYPQCTAFHAFALAEIKKLHPAQIYVTGGTGAVGDIGGDLTGATRLLKDLRTITPDTTVLSNIPWPVINPVTCLSAHSGDIGGCSMPYGEFTSSNAQFRRALKKAAAKSGTTFADLDSLFCTTTTCPVVVNDILVYADDFHITWQYSAYVAAALDQVLTPTFTTRSQRG